MADADGEIALEAAHTGEQRPGSAELIGLLTEAMRQAAGRGEARAVAIVADVSTEVAGDPTDALRVSIEHRDADPITVLQPTAGGACAAAPSPT